MVVIVSSPKPFTKDFYLEQWNAILSWKALEFPSCAGPKKIVLCGCEEGVGVVCRILDLIHHPNIRVNEYGTPYVMSIFQAAYTYTTSDTEPVLYINTDIILDMRLVDTWTAFYQQIVPTLPFPKRYLLVGERMDWTEHFCPFEEFRYGHRGSLKLDYYIRVLEKRAVHATRDGIDYFLHTRQTYYDDNGHCMIQPFVTRYSWDSWLVYYAILQKNIRAVDVSSTVQILHHRGKQICNRKTVGRYFNSDESKANRAIFNEWIRRYPFILHQLDGLGWISHQEGNKIQFIERERTIQVTLETSVSPSIIAEQINNMLMFFIEKEETLYDTNQIHWVDWYKEEKQDKEKEDKEKEDKEKEDKEKEDKEKEDKEKEEKKDERAHIIVFCQYYNDRNVERQKEYDHCLWTNIHHPLVKAVYDFIEPQTTVPTRLKHTCHHCIPHTGRLTFQNVFTFIQKHIPTHTVVLILNLDICLPSTEHIYKAWQTIQPDFFDVLDPEGNPISRALCLSRHEWDWDGRIWKTNMVSCSFDAWCFQTPLLDILNCDFSIGNCPTCDIAIAHRIKNSDYHVYNWGLKYMIWHVDRLREGHYLHQRITTQTDMSNPGDSGKIYSCPYLPYDSYLKLGKPPEINSYCQLFGAEIHDHSDHITTDIYEIVDKVCVWDDNVSLLDQLQCVYDHYRFVSNVLLLWKGDERGIHPYFTPLSMHYMSKTPSDYDIIVVTSYVQNQLISVLTPERYEREYTMDKSQLFSKYAFSSQDVWEPHFNVFTVWPKRISHNVWDYPYLPPQGSFIISLKGLQKIIDILKDLKTNVNSFDALNTLCIYEHLRQLCIEPVSRLRDNCPLHIYWWDVGPVIHKDILPTLQFVFLEKIIKK